MGQRQGRTGEMASEIHSAGCLAEGREGLPMIGSACLLPPCIRAMYDILLFITLPGRD